MVDNTSTNFPNSKTRFTTEEGLLTKEGSVLLRALWNRTGGGTGADLAVVKATADAAAAAVVALNLATMKKAANLSDVANVPTSRNNLGLGSVALGNTVAGWVDPAGTGSRAAINADFTQTAGAIYSQSDYQAVIDQLLAVQKALAQLILDNKSARVISN